MSRRKLPSVQTLRKLENGSSNYLSVMTKRKEKPKCPSYVLNQSSHNLCCKSMSTDEPPMPKEAPRRTLASVAMKSRGFEGRRRSRWAKLFPVTRAADLHDEAPRRKGRVFLAANHSNAAPRHCNNANGSEETQYGPLKRLRWPKLRDSGVGDRCHDGGVLKKHNRARWDAVQAG